MVFQIQCMYFSLYFNVLGSSPLAGGLSASVTVCNQTIDMCVWIKFNLFQDITVSKVVIFHQIPWAALRICWIYQWIEYITSRFAWGVDLIAPVIEKSVCCWELWCPFLCLLPSIGFQIPYFLKSFLPHVKVTSISSNRTFCDPFPINHWYFGSFESSKVIPMNAIFNNWFIAVYLLGLLWTFTSRSNDSFQSLQPTISEISKQSNKGVLFYQIFDNLGEIERVYLESFVIFTKLV